MSNAVPDSSQTQKQGRPVCPACDQQGRQVQRVTLEALLKPEVKLRIIDAQHHFCSSVDCDVVYYSTDPRSQFLKQDVTVRVGQKETDDPVQVCYCFNYFRADIAKDIQNTGDTTIPASIQTEIKAGTCSCETKNPQGG